MNSLVSALTRIGQLERQFQQYFSKTAPRNTFTESNAASAQTPATPTAALSPFATSFAATDILPQNLSSVNLVDGLTNGLTTQSPLGNFKELLNAKLQLASASPTTGGQQTAVKQLKTSPIQQAAQVPVVQTRQLTTFPFQAQITAAAEANGLPVALFRSLVAAESNFNPLAVSAKGAMGLTQLMPQTAVALGVTEPYDVEANLQGGARYLRMLLDKYGGDYAKALAAYNAGEKAVARADELSGVSVPPYAETNQYVKRVLTSYLKYSGVSL